MQREAKGHLVLKMLAFLSAGMALMTAIGYGVMVYGFSNVGMKNEEINTLWILANIGAFFASYPLWPLLDWMDLPLSGNQEVFLCFALNGAFWASIALAGLLFIKKLRLILPRYNKRTKA